jgi:N-acetylglucosaminyl-diphospho-decaprenol L-rhamnosyltransferase
MVFRTTGSGIAAIIVCYGAEGHLAECLRALQAQGEVRPDRVVLVDNNPPALRLDGERITSIAGRPVEVLVPEQNLGYGRAVNLALTRVREEFVLVVNPDLVLEENGARVLLHALQQDPRGAAAGPSLRHGNACTFSPAAARAPGLARDLLTLSGWSRLERKGQELRAAECVPRSTEFLPGACFLARRAAFQEIGGFDARFFLYYEDADLCRRWLKAGWRLFYVPEARARHVHGGSWEDAARRQSISLQGALVYYRKHLGRTGAALYRSGLLGLYVPRLLLGGALHLIPGLKTSFGPGQRARLLLQVLRTALGPARAAAGASAWERQA